MVTVQDRSAGTLIPLIKKYILPGTKVISDCWKSYSTIQQEGYIHGTVNHSIEFVNSETGDHTQTIESTWKAVKRSLPLSGTVTEMYDSYFAEYIFRKHYLQEADDRFLTFLKKAREVYQPSLT
uniref:ISXO2-like transposase domain-containing protein n=1 Tax=Amphimedon queenslandica TaxID=400682 RepID=A0A1X7UDC0_AMPQE